MYESIRYTQTVFDTLVEIYMSFGTAHTTILFSWSLEDILHRKSFGSIEIRWQRWCVKRIYIIIIKIDTVPISRHFFGHLSLWVSEWVCPEFHDSLWIFVWRLEKNRMFTFYISIHMKLEIKSIWKGFKESSRELTFEGNKIIWLDCCLCTVL